MTEPQRADGPRLRTLWRSCAPAGSKGAGLCEGILRSAPRDPAAHQLAATVALRRGRLEDAARSANSSLELRPDHVPTLIVAARAARAAGDIAQARLWLERAGRLAPDRPEPLF